jgi:hypothetical protein
MNPQRQTREILTKQKRENSAPKDFYDSLSGLIMSSGILPALEFSFAHKDPLERAVQKAVANPDNPSSQLYVLAQASKVGGRLSSPESEVLRLMRAPPLNPSWFLGYKKDTGKYIPLAEILSAQLLPVSPEEHLPLSENPLLFPLRNITLTGRKIIGEPQGNHNVYFHRVLADIVYEGNGSPSLLFTKVLDRQSRLFK